MGGPADGALSTEQAKRRLRAAASRLGPRAWVRSRPYESLGVSFLLGMALASEPRLRRAALRLLLARD
ncbi:MAG: hypothetical protein PVF91_06820 [Chromatiales bacterium]|jgi:hypothetical protein